jgi:uncharacterized membrane protein
METTRLETFSDGVFAIAATLLILEVYRAGGSVTHGLIHAWPSYVAYAISFLTIGIIWVNHHTVMAADRPRRPHVPLHQRVFPPTGRCGSTPRGTVG